MNKQTKERTNGRTNKRTNKQTIHRNKDKMRKDESYSLTIKTKKQGLKAACRPSFPE